MNIYEVKTMGARIAGNPYVGRGIAIGRSADGAKAVFAYFIMGRSVNSRNRVFIKTADGIRTEAFDPAKLADPSLIIYSPVRRCGNSIVVTNGDQTDTICDYLAQGSDMEAALETRTFEPDGPNFTPRISGELQLGETYRYKMSILKSMDEVGTDCTRQYFRYTALPGLGHFIHTYVTDGNPIPTFQGEPERVSIPNDIDAFTADIWDNLNEDNKISLYVSYTDLNTGAEETRLINKNQ
ncbi:MAG: IMP cyclohydrolase [Oscillospiraceae bacterium]|nr:IMP cyclohydrolase [Oscillospiraceae bacterium]